MCAKGTTQPLVQAPAQAPHTPTLHGSCAHCSVTGALGCIGREVRVCVWIEPFHRRCLAVTWGCLATLAASSDS